MKIKTGHVFIIILFISIGLYANSLKNSFQYDDQVGIEENLYIRSADIGRIFLKPSALFSAGRFDESMGHYRPLVLLTYIINYRLGGINPAGYHLVNLAFHAGAAFLLFLIVKFMLSNGDKNLGIFAALAAALIFLAHPFNSEVVNYITARSSVMSSFFYLLAFFCWVKFRKQLGSGKKLSTIYYFASLLAFIAGMLTKEIVVTLPVMLFLYDVFFFPVNSKHSTGRLKTYLRTSLQVLPFILAVVIPYLLIRKVTWGGVLPPFKRTPLVQFYTELPVLVKYLRLFILPAGLNIGHFSEIHKSFFRWPVMVSAVILISFIVLAVLLYRLKKPEWRTVSFFIIWFFVVLLPTTLIPLNMVLQENRGYLAFIVFAVSAGILLSKLINSGKDRGLRGEYLYTGILVVLLVIYGTVTLQRNSVWRNGITLWSDAVKKSETSAMAYVNLGTAYAKAGENDLAIENFRMALRYAGPENGGDPVTIHYNLGTVYQQTGRFDLAVDEYTIVTEIKPDDYRPFYNLGVIYHKMGKLEEAIAAYTNVLRRNPYNFKSYHNLGLIYQSRQGMGDIITAEKYYKEAVKLNPEYVKSRVNLAAIYEAKGDIELARQEYIAVIRSFPDYSPAYYNLAAIYEREGNLNMALKIFRGAQRLKPDDKWLLSHIKTLEQKVVN